MLEELSAQKEYGDRVIQDMTNKKKQVELEMKHRLALFGFVCRK